MLVAATRPLSLAGLTSGYELIFSMSSEGGIGKHQLLDFKMFQSNAMNLRTKAGG